MVNILVISNDRRVDALVKLFQPQLLVRISAVKNFDQGLKEVFDKRPAAVFIQGEVAGVAGSAVASHIKGLLRSDAPRMILMQELAGKKLQLQNVFDEGIDLSLPEAELTKRFRGELEKVPGLQWRQGSEGQAAKPRGSAAEELFAELTIIPAPVTVEVTEPLDLDAITSYLDLDAETKPVGKSAPSVPSPPATPSPHPMPSPVPPTAPVLKEQPKPSRQPLPSPESPLPPLVIPGSGTVQSPRIRPSAASADQAGQGETLTLPPFETLMVDPPKRRHRLWLIMALVCSFLAGGTWMYVKPGREGGNSPPAAAKEMTTAPQPGAGQLVAPLPARSGALPAIIPAGGLDPTYSQQHPGWERYLDKDLEFRVFREGGTIRAVQLMARGNGAIDGKVQERFLQELSGSAAVTVNERKEQGDYLRERATLPGGGELLIYKKRKTGETRAMVVAFS